jgi:iron complex outermembrane receptor protein
MTAHTRRPRHHPDFRLTPVASTLRAALFTLALSGASAHAADAASPAPAAPKNNDAPQGTVLPPVVVRAEPERETATGPVKGFVARRSAAATKTDTPAIETPQSISVVTRHQMDAQNAQSIGDALRYTAGVFAEANGLDPRTDVISIRGSNSFGNSAYRDGLRDYTYNNQGGVVIEPYGLERIDVLRGPASVLYGQGDAGGIVHLVTKRPTAERVREIQAQVGSHDRRQVALDLGGAFDETSPWSYRLTGLFRESDTQVDHVKDDRIYIAPSVAWRPSSATSLTLLSHYQKTSRGQGYQALPRVGTLEPGAGGGKLPTNRFVGEPGFERHDVERTSVGYAFEHQLNDRWTIRQNARVMSQTLVHNTTYLAGPAVPDDGVTIQRYIGQGREHLRNDAIDNQVQWKSKPGGVEQTVLAGVDFLRVHNRLGGNFNVAPNLDVYNPVYGGPMPEKNAPADIERAKLNQTGVYAQDQLKFGDRLSWTIGGRFDKTRADTADLTNGAHNPRRDRAFTWRTGAVYQLGNGLAPYAGYAKSFLPLTGKDFSGNAFEPETGEQFEVGIRYEPKNQNLSFIASVFDLRRQNVLTADPVNFNSQIQTGEIRTCGLELEFKASVLRNVDVIASYAFNDREVTRSNSGDLGKTPNGSPRNMAAVWTSWRIPAAADLKLSAGVRHVGDRFGDDVEAVRLPAYTLVDAAVEVDLARLLQTSGDLRLGLNISNLFDKTYVAACGYYGDGCKYGFRRSAAATVSYRW